jgi:hypothetical protein
MDTSIIVALITIFGGVIAFILTKRHEIKSEWKKEKLNHYKVLLSSLSDLAVDGMDKNKANEKFALAVNTIALVAPQSVVNVLMEFHDYVKFSNKDKTAEGHDKLLVKLLLEIRKDIGLSKKDNPETFNFHLIGSKPRS